MIKTEQLTKRYGSLTAVDNLSFAVEPGEVLGFLGPNGAGKSTTMKMLTGFVAPTSGTAAICSHDIEKDPLPAKTCMGYLPEGAPSYGEMTVRGFLEFIAQIRGLTGDRRRTRLDDVVERLHLGRVMQQTIETLSKGFKRRVGLAQAVLHDPQVLILDEPTDGLDPNQKHEVRSLIKDMSADKIIIVSTHILEEVEAVCSRAIIIASGRLLADDTPAGLVTRSRYHNAVSMRFEPGVDLVAVETEVGGLPEVAQTERNEAGDGFTAFPADDRLLLPGISSMAAARAWPLKELHLESGRLDEVFRDITGGAAQ
jgi:ABC-2 type transport system ATP-binding protein